MKSVSGCNRPVRRRKTLQGFIANGSVAGANRSNQVLTTALVLLQNRFGLSECSSVPFTAGFSVRSPRTLVHTSGRRGESELAWSRGDGSEECVSCRQNESETEERATASDRVTVPTSWMCVSRQSFCRCAAAMATVSRSRRCGGTAGGSSPQTPAEVHPSRSPCRQCAGSERRAQTILQGTHTYVRGLCKRLNYCISSERRKIR